jgi:iron-sulfur cluster repair protein YtfE (RIC family)
MKKTIDVLEILESQHAEVDTLIEQLERNTDNRARLFIELADKLAAHAAVEEQILYPMTMNARTSEMLHEAVEEHLAFKRVLADMLLLDPVADEQDFKAKLSVLKEEISHHAHEEEEGKLFPLLRSLMSADERAAIGNEVLAEYEAMLGYEPRRNVPHETAAAAPLPQL